MLCLSCRPTLLQEIILSTFTSQCHNITQHHNIHILVRKQGKETEGKQLCSKVCRKVHTLPLLTCHQPELSYIAKLQERLGHVICRQVATCSVKIWSFLLVKRNGESGYWGSNQQSLCRELEQSLPVKPDLSQTFVCVSSPYSCCNVPGFDPFLAACLLLCIPFCISVCPSWLYLPLLPVYSLSPLCSWDIIFGLWLSVTPIVCI